MRGLSKTALVLGLGLRVVDADALVWPDVPERLERGIASPDAVTRRAAARDLASLGGPRATPLVRRALGDPDVEVRLAAAQSAIRLHVTEATGDVVGWLGESDARLRVFACEVAHAMPSATAVPSLARALGDGDPQVRTACADALGVSGSADAVAPLSGRLDDATPNVRAQVARALARLGDPRAVVPLVGKVQDSAPDVRQAVVRALGELGDTRATQALLLALRDNAPEVKIDALTALGRLRAPEAVDAIAPLALDRNPVVRQAALVALGRIAVPSAIRALTKTLGTQDDAAGGLDRTPVRDALVAAGPSAISELTSLLDRPVLPSAAISAAWVLGELRARESAPRIVAALRKGALPASAALHALAGAGTPEQVPVVLEFVADPNPATREEALRAAASLLDPTRPDGRAVEPLAAALTSPRTSTRERAALATLLGRTGAPRAATLIVGLVNADDELLRIAAIDAIGALGAEANTASDDVLVPLLADVNPAIRLHAATALGASGGINARGTLLSKLSGGGELDRFVLFSALGGILDRHPDEAASRTAFAELGVAAGAERDAVIEAAGRARLPGVVNALASVTRSADADDRRAVASVLATHVGSAPALTLARSLTNDAAPNVRAEATFALGALGDVTLVSFLVGLARTDDTDVATNAVGAIARIARRALFPSEASASNPIADAVCPLLVDRRPTVRANALVALATLRRRCSDGRVERALLAEDSSERVRGSAARAITSTPLPDDPTAIERCAASDRSAEVARRCRPNGLPPRAARTHTVTIFVFAEEGSKGARPHAPYLLEYEDGVLRAGSADRRGAIFDPVAPDGVVVLRRPPRP